MQIDLADKPKVIALASRLNLDTDSIVGKLHRLWGWADRQTTDGNAPGVTPAFIDARLGVTGFALALEAVGWLEVSEAGIRLLHFEEHNGKTAKTRALTARRVTNCKRKGNAKDNAEGNAEVTASALPREEKRRVYKTDTKYVSDTPIAGAGKKKFEPDPLLDSPGVRLYRDRMHLTPSAGITRERIAAEVTDLAKWGAVLDAWKLRGFKPANIEGQLAWYQNGIPEWRNGREQQQREVGEARPVPNKYSGIGGGGSPQT